MDGEEGGCVHDKDARSSGRCDIGIWHSGAETREGNLGVDSMTCSRGEGWSKRRDLHPRKVVSHCTKGSKEVGASASCVPIWASAPEEPYTAPYKEHRAGWGQNLTQVPHLWVIKKGGVTRDYDRAWQFRGPGPQGGMPGVRMLCRASFQEVLQWKTGKEMVSQEGL